MQGGGELLELGGLALLVLLDQHRQVLRQLVLVLLAHLDLELGGDELLLRGVEPLLCLVQRTRRLIDLLADDGHVRGDDLVHHTQLPPHVLKGVGLRRRPGGTGPAALW
eukprot:TRINITY_DN5740_c0_g1_i1.p3 TRINITY_DN5740_c0_g1~~TRINITY_DN5740_c0_g1_i1.p3  ORF type:complete len:109 (-),score=27.96 TRINITY_DN5740_c0_g1_i1:366-692(-)